MYTWCIIGAIFMPYFSELFKGVSAIRNNIKGNFANPSGEGRSPVRFAPTLSGVVHPQGHSIGMRSVSSPPEAVGGTMELYVQDTVNGSGHISVTLKDKEGMMVGHLSFGPTNYAAAMVTVLQVPVPGVNTADPAYDHAHADRVHSVDLDETQFARATSNIHDLTERIKHREIHYSLGSSFGRVGKVIPQFLLSAAASFASAMHLKAMSSTFGHESLALSSADVPSREWDLSAHNCITIAAEMCKNAGLVHINFENATIPTHVSDALSSNPRVRTQELRNRLREAMDGDEPSPGLGHH